MRRAFALLMQCLLESRCLRLILSIAIMIYAFSPSIIPRHSLVPTAQAQSAGNAAITRAIQYAYQHWDWNSFDNTDKSFSIAQAGDYQEGFECAEFVARSLAAAGPIGSIINAHLLPISSKHDFNSMFYQGNQYLLVNVGGRSENQGYAWYGLYDYLVSTGIGQDTNIGTDIASRKYKNIDAITPGSVVFYGNQDDNGAWTLEHTALVTRVNKPSNRAVLLSDILVTQHNRAFKDTPIDGDGRPIVHIVRIDYTKLAAGDFANDGNGKASEGPVRVNGPAPYAGGRVNSTLTLSWAPVAGVQAYNIVFYNNYSEQIQDSVLTNKTTVRINLRNSGWPQGYYTYTIAAAKPGFAMFYDTFTYLNDQSYWLSPQDRGKTGRFAHFAATAGIRNAGDPAIDHINFTVGWPARSPEHWTIACMVQGPSSQAPGRMDMYLCTPDVDLHQLGIPPGDIRVSFDIYDQAGIAFLAPSGERTVTYGAYLPSVTSSPTPTYTFTPVPTSTFTPPPAPTFTPPPTPTFTPIPKPIVPGGMWISPMNGQQTSGTITFAAHAYPTNPGDPAIAYVNFTVGWPALGSAPWKKCTAYPPSSGDVFTCSVDLGQLGAPAGPLQVSFDVYDQAGHVNMAPNGVHTISYAPPVPAVPGGVWHSPSDGDTVTGIVHFEVEAYPTNPGDPPIKNVNFTVGWPVPNPTNWVIGCQQYTPTSTLPNGHGVYSCDVDLSKVGAPMGQLRVSFDVYDQAWTAGMTTHVNYAPNGEHTITYGSPPPITQGETLTLNPTSGPAGSQVCLTWTDDNDHPGAIGTISFDGQQLGTYQSGPSTENWSGCVTIPTSAQPGNHTIQLHETSDNSGQSATFTVTGSNPPVCAASFTPCNGVSITTDRTAYHVGDTARYCYTVPGPAHVVVTDYAADGTSQVVLNGTDSGTGGCQSGTISPPTGQERLHLDVYSLANGSLLGSADATFTVS